MDLGLFDAIVWMDARFYLMEWNMVYDNTCNMGESNAASQKKMNEVNMALWCESE